jgi:hypothetical protein
MIAFVATCIRFGIGRDRTCLLFGRETPSSSITAGRTVYSEPEGGSRLSGPFARSDGSSRALVSIDEETHTRSSGGEGVRERLHTDRVGIQLRYVQVK